MATAKRDTDMRQALSELLKRKMLQTVRRGVGTQKVRRPAGSWNIKRMNGASNMRMGVALVPTHLVATPQAEDLIDEECRSFMAMSGEVEVRAGFAGARYAEWVPDITPHARPGPAGERPRRARSSHPQEAR